MVTGRTSLEHLLNRNFSNRRVLITGYNGFVGTWLSLLLQRSGASVFGIALEPLS
jgi:CDP-glucose 4,6-dehydratase